MQRNIPANVHCDIVSEEGEVFSGLVKKLLAPGRMGTLGIHPGHSALITDLAAGTLHLTQDSGEEKHIVICGGFLEVQPMRVKVLAYGAEAANQSEP